MYGIDERWFAAPNDGLLNMQDQYLDIFWFPNI